MTTLFAALLLLAPTPPRVYAHVVPWHPPSHSRPDRALDLDGGGEGMIRAARAAGVDGFTIDLVISDPAVCLGILREYLTAAERVGEFTVGPCLDVAGVKDPAVWTRVLTGWHELAASHRGAMRHDGRLVVFTFDAAGLSAAAWRQVKADCARAGAEPLIVAEVEGLLRQGARAEATVREMVGALDAAYLFSPFPEGQQRLTALQRGSGHEHPVIYAPSPGYWRVNTGALSRVFGGTATWQQTWQEARAAGAEWAVVTTWNDYTESTHIEPSRNNSDLLARWTAVEAARLKGTDAVAAAGRATYWLTVPPELPDGPGRGPLEANPRRETVFEVTRIGPPGPAVEVVVRLSAPDGAVVEQRRLSLPGGEPITCARFTWEPSRTLGVPFLRAGAVVAGVQASLPIHVWPRQVAHRFTLAPLRAKLVATPPAAPVLRLAERRLQVEPIAPPAPARVDLLHDLTHRSDPRSTTGAVARGADQLPAGPPAWGFWSAARVEPGGAVSWADPLWLAPQGDLLLLAHYRFAHSGDDQSPYRRTAIIHSPAGLPWQAGQPWLIELADGSRALRCDKQVWAEPPGSFLPFAGPLTVALWCRPSAPGGMLFGDVAAPLLLSLDRLTPRVTRCLAGGRWVTAAAPQPVPLNRWSHVAGVYDGRDLVLYVDAVEVARTPAGAGLGSERMAIGRNPYDGSSPFHGLIRAVIIRGEAVGPGGFGTPDPRQARPAEPVPR